MNDGKCTNCITYSYECTYVEIAKKRGPPKGYVESLENRLEKMENLLRRVGTVFLGPCLDVTEAYYVSNPLGESQGQREETTRLFSMQY
jgi:hypothetical protein